MVQSESRTKRVCKEASKEGRGRMTEEEFIELCLKNAPPGSKVKKHEKDGYTYFTVGELNIDRAARAFLDLINKQEAKERAKKLHKDDEE